eukprot:SAG25_NODE_12548_length_278_cov_1.016760_1_plen_21_part_10
MGSMECRFLVKNYYNFYDTTP